MNVDKSKEYKGELIEEIDEEFQDLANELNNMDFSKDSNKNYVFEKANKNIYYQEDSNISKIKKAGIAVASLLIIFTMAAQTTFAKEAINTILNTISLNHFTAIQTNDNKDDDYSETLSDDLKEKLFDKNGNALEKVTKNAIKEGVYTKDGEEVYNWTYKDGTAVAIGKKDKDQEEILYITDSSKLNNYTCFDVKLPAYLPDGYTFEKAGFYKDEYGNVKDSKYVGLYFKNSATGKEIYMQERVACEGTRGDLATNERIEKIKINGVDAVLEGENFIVWEANNTIYYLIGEDSISKGEVIKIAESIK